MTSIFSKIDDKYVPLYRVMWIADVPHFCGSEDCNVEGRYEIRLEQDETVWANREERDSILTALELWHGGLGAEEEEDDWE